MTTPQQQADAYLAAWRLCAALEIEPELRLPLIDVLCELERAKVAAVARNISNQWEGTGQLERPMPLTGTRIHILSEYT